MVHPLRRSARAGIVAIAIELGTAIGLKATDDNDTPDISWSQYRYVGSFLPPPAGFPDARAAYSNGAIAYHDGGLYITSHVWFPSVAKISIPNQLGDVRTHDELPYADFLIDWSDIGSPVLDQLPGTTAKEIAGLVVHQPPGYDRPVLWFTVRDTYNVSGETLPSHASVALNLDPATVTGLWSFAQGWPPSNATAGHLISVPQAWADKAGVYSLWTGLSGASGILGSSVGPVAFAISPWSTDLTDTLDSQEIMLHAPPDHEFRTWPRSADYPSGISGQASFTSGATWLERPGFRPALAFAGRRGERCYYGDPDGHCNNSRGSDGSPYHVEIMVYPEAEVFRAIAGTPAWHLRCEVTELSDIMPVGCYDRIGLAADNATGRIFVSQALGASVGGEPVPVVHVFAAR